MNKEMHKRLYDLASRDAEIFQIVFDEELMSVETLRDVFMDNVEYMKDFTTCDLQYLKDVSTALLKYEDPYIWLEKGEHIRIASDVKIKYILKDIARLLAKRLDAYLNDFTYRIEVDERGNIVTGGIVQSPLEWLETEEENYKEVLKG